MAMRAPDRRWRRALVGAVGAGGLVLAAIGLQARPTPRAAEPPVSAWLTTLHVHDEAVPEDPELLRDLQRAVDLRARERFDRVLDARDPGELIEHATLTETVFERRTIGIDALFIVGDEFFGYAFRPENGWGHGSPDRHAPNYTPRLRRVHDGRMGGPDAFGCFSCHSKGGPDGAGTQTQNGFFFGDGERTSSADQRNAPHLLGMGPIEILGREMTRELQAEATAALATARSRDVRRAAARRQGRGLRARGRRQPTARSIAAGSKASMPTSSCVRSGGRGIRPRSAT